MPVIKKKSFPDVIIGPKGYKTQPQLPPIGDLAQARGRAAVVEHQVETGFYRDPHLFTTHGKIAVSVILREDHIVPAELVLPDQPRGDKGSHPRLPVAVEESA